MKGRYLMDNPNFDFEFYSEVPDENDELRGLALTRLEALAADRRDMIGAAVALEDIANERTPHRFKARIVAYTKPRHLAATEKGGSAETALKGAIQAIERQVHAEREKMRKPWQKK
jgi:ribosome-associated translation inhibitor RaiA